MNEGAREDVIVGATPQVMNPWRSIWRQPRATIRQVVESNPEKHVHFIAAVTGAASALDRASSRNLGDRLDFWFVLPVALILGLLFGLLGLYLWAALLRWTGRWLGGQASTLHLRAAISWSCVPLVAVAVLWIPELLIAGPDMFTAETPRLDANPGMAMLLIPLFLLEIVASIWAFVLLCQCVGEVQEFSAWKGLGNSLLAALVIAVPMIAVAVLTAMLTR